MTDVWSGETLLMTTNSSVNRNLPSAINNWNCFSKSLLTKKVIKTIFLHDQMSYEYDLK